MLIKKEIIINAPPKKVWKTFSKLEKWPEWSSHIVKAYWTSPKKWALNSTFTQIVKKVVPFKNLASNSKILKIKTYAVVIWTGSRTLIRGIHTFKFDKIKNKTKVQNIEKFTGVLAPFIFPFIKKKFELYFEQFLRELKKESEK